MSYIFKPFGAPLIGHAHIVTHSSDVHGQYCEAQNFRPKNSCSVLCKNKTSKFEICKKSHNFELISHEDDLN